MTEPTRKKVSKSMLSLTLLFAGLLVVLIACDTPPPPVLKPELTLSVDKTNLADGGGEVVLTAKVTKGKATSVTFKADTGAVIPPVTSANATGDFVARVNVTATTKFTAQATGPTGAGTATEAKTVTVAPPNPVNDPKAPSSTSALEGFEDVHLVVGASSGLAVTVTTIPGVTGEISGEVQSETKDTGKGKVTIKAGTDKLEFVYEPNPGATDEDFFEYTVVKTGREAKGRIDINLQSLPSDIDVINGDDDVADINASSSQRIFLAKDVTCSTNPCVRLKAGQQFIGVGSVTVDGVTIANTSSTRPKITANIPGTRQPGTPGGSGSESRVIELADNTRIEGIEIDGTGQRYFVALFGATYEGSSVLEGDIAINNVLIKNSNGKPVYFKCSDFPCSQSVDYGGYDLTIEALRVENAFDTLVIGAPGSLVFEDSFVELSQPTVNSRSFGDNVGIDVEDMLSASLEFNDVDVFMESPKNKLDNNPINYSAVPFVITNRRSGSTTDLTFTNNDITFGDPDSNWSLSSVRTIKLSASAGASISISSGSVSNTSEATGNDVERIGTITGTLGGLE
jgi:hypothetical protein